MKTLPARLLLSIACTAMVSVLVLGITFFAHLFWEHKILIWGLPVAGYLLGRTKKIGRLAEIGEGDRVWSEMQHPDSHALPFLLSLWLLVGSFWSHLFGASVGREGAAVQVGAIVADSGRRFLAKKIRSLQNVARIEILQLGIMAGFCVAFGTPIASIVFALESTSHDFSKPLSRRLHLQRVAWLILPAVVVFYFKKLFGLHYFDYPLLPVSELAPLVILNWIVFSAVCLIAAILYETLLYGVRDRLKPLPKPWVLFAAGLLLTGFVWYTGSSDYQSLGENLIHAAFAQEKTWVASFLKMLTTLISLSAGFMGGEVVPLMGAGAVFGQLGSDFFTLGPQAIVVGSVIFFSYRLRAPLAGFVFLLEKLLGINAWQNSFLGLAIPFLLLAIYLRRNHPDTQH